MNIAIVERSGQRHLDRDSFVSIQNVSIGYEENNNDDQHQPFGVSDAAVALGARWIVN